MTRTLAFAALAVTLALGGCSRVVDTDELESQISSELQRQAGVTPTSVECPDDVPAEAGGTFNCTATADDGSTATIEVVQKDDQGNLEWEVVSTG